MLNGDGFVFWSQHLVKNLTGVGVREEPEV